MEEKLILSHAHKNNRWAPTIVNSPSKSSSLVCGKVYFLVVGNFEDIYLKMCKKWGYNGKNEGFSPKIAHIEGTVINYGSIGFTRLENC